MDDLEFLDELDDSDDEFILSDDLPLDDEFIRTHFNTCDNGVIENFPFIEDDVDAITDYELFSRGFGYLDDKKADKDELSEYAKKSDIPDVSDFVKENEISEVGFTGKYDDLIDKPELFSGDYDDLTNKPTIPTKTSDLDNDSEFITKSVNDLTYYTKTSDLATVATTGDYDDLLDKPTIPDVSNFITKDVNDLTYYTKTSDLATVATTGDYDDLLDKPTIPTVPTNVSAFNNDSGYITKSVNDLTNYTTTTVLTSLLANKENVSVIGNNTNGSFIKFDNGIIIEYGIVDLGSISYTTSYGGIFLGGTKNITLPYQFDNVNMIDSINTSLVNIGGGVGGISGSGYNRSSLQVYPWHATSATLSTIVSFIVIGRWK